MIWGPIQSSYDINKGIEINIKLNILLTEELEEYMAQRMKGYDRDYTKILKLYLYFIS